MLKTFMSKKQSEIELLLCCARTHLDPETCERIHSLSQTGIDWNYLVQTAIRHRVMPLLYRNLKKTCPQTVPVGTMKQLQRYFLVNAARNHVLSHELLSILGMLEQNGIIAVPFKGPVLAEYLYGDLALRQFDDLDILIHRHDAYRAHELLVSYGYQPGLKLGEEQNGSYSKAEYSMSYSRSGIRAPIEFHWDMLGKYSPHPLGINNLQRLETGTLDNKNVWHLSPEDLLIYLCLHGSKDCWKTFEAVCSVAELVRSHPALDWTWLATRVETMHCERMLFLGLFMANDLLGVDLPAHLCETIKADQRIREIAEEIYVRLFPGDDELSQSQFDPNFSSFQVKVRDMLTEKIRYCLSLVFRPTREDWRRFPLPASLSFLHYLFRPIRLARGLAETLLKGSYRNPRERSEWAVKMKD